MSEKNIINYVNCPVTYCMSMIGGKWKTIIIYLISIGVNRFGVMHRSIEGISKHMLTTQLRELEKDGILKRKIFAEIPPRVEYSITTKGETLSPIIISMKIWGEKNMVKSKQ
ncbi:MAG: helix-turn-helix transcriptional regulator [candidate division Zixibacteria bacterium]|nr:helix-turn-helix transcriptional regulator [candidate division Zixibacteria bacterium]